MIICKHQPGSDTPALNIHTKNVKDMSCDY